MGLITPTSRRRAAAAIATAGFTTVRWAGELIARADRATMSTLPAWRKPVGIAVARGVSTIAEPAFISPLLATAAALAFRRSGWRDAKVPVLVVPAGVLVRGVLSELIARPRPPACLWLVEPQGYSFPSRHATLAALTAGALATTAGTAGVAAHAIPLAAAASIGMGRVYLGVHWPSDVLAGWLYAVAWLGLARLCMPGTAAGDGLKPAAAAGAPARRRL